jgi:ATP-dependent protease ClpP protease subunit
MSKYYEIIIDDNGNDIISAFNKLKSLANDKDVIAYIDTLGGNTYEYLRLCRLIKERKNKIICIK